MKKPKSYKEPSEEEILAGIRRGMQQALRGEERPALEFLDELDREEESQTFQNGDLQDSDDE